MTKDMLFIWLIQRYAITEIFLALTLLTGGTMYFHGFIEALKQFFSESYQSYLHVPMMTRCHS